MKEVRPLSNLETLRGVGPRMKQKLIRNDVYDCFDLIRRFPKKYEIYQLTNLADAPDESRITIEAIVTTPAVVHYIRRNLNRLSFSVIIENRTFQVSIFNREYLKNILTVGREIVLTGTLNRTKRMFTATTLKMRENLTSEIEAVYDLEGISDKQMGKLVKQAIRDYGHLLFDDLPEDLRIKYRLLPYLKLVNYAHFPTTQEDLKQVSRRLKYEELLKFQLKLQYIRLKKRAKKIKAKTYDVEEVKSMIRALPFALTFDQKKVVREILKDLSSPHPMNRLLQGDVGSGKTVVAAISALAALSAGYQVAVMAPTDLLAKQHFNTFSVLLQNTKYKVLLLTGKMDTSVRKETEQQLSFSTPILVVGTHALFSEHVQYGNLGLVITDEQHRFGVNQRKKMREKGEMPDILYISASPKPRTLANSNYGDMDITKIRQKPANRKPVETKLFCLNQLDMVELLMEEELRKNRQIYVVTPLILESEVSSLANAHSVYQQLVKRFPHYNVGIIHSKIQNESKERIMDDFYSGNMQILVSTTVIEVGVDNPNATMMVVFNAERFGLSQLHQLRGRVGRGNTQSYCLLLCSDESASERLRVLEQTDDGFVLSQEDLHQRGPGDFFGVRQSGDMKFQYANLVDDTKILEIARQDAFDILMDKECFKDPQYKRLFQHLKKSIKGMNLD